MEQTFFKIFPPFIKKLSDLTHSEIKLFLELASIMQFSSNSILLDKSLKITIAERMNLTEKTFSNLLSRLISKKMVFRNGFYIIVNSEYAKKGR